MVQVNTCARLLLLACAGLPALAQRGNNDGHTYTPIVCNNVPTQAPGQAQARRSVQSLDEAAFLGSAPTVTTADIPMTTAHGPGVLVESAAPKASSPSRFTIRGGRREDSDSELDSRLTKRGGKITYADNCKANLPSGSNNFKSLFPDQKTILMSDIAKLGYDQAVRLAAFASNVKADNTGYKHYYGTTNVDKMHTIWTKMMNLIATPDENFNIEFNCDLTAKQCTVGKNDAVAFTDISVANPAMQQKTINLCKAYFTSASTRFVLPDKEHLENSPPFRDLTSSGWCNKKSVANFYATIGHTILHELTHLDTLGKQAGLEADKNGRHSTEDLVSDPEDPTLCQLYGARDWLINGWGKDKSEGDPTYNAESYAGAATEAFFMDACPNNVLTDIPAK